MIYVVCSVRDRTSLVFSQPFYSPTLESSIRSFRILINDPNGGLPHSHPDDFDLYHVGSFDDSPGIFTPPPGGYPVQIAIGKEMVKPLSLARG